jgi:ATP adenylyltransferase
MARAGLDRLWSPWRMGYIRTADEPAGCLFCAVHRSRADRKHLVLARLPGALLMLNRYPYNPAHLMVAVRRHAGSFAELNAGEREDLLALTALAERAIEHAYAPHGMNYGANAGRVAGAGFPGQLHLHLVPRWNGDTNFMPTVAETRVLPEALGATWTRLRRAIRAIERPAAPAAPARPRSGARKARHARAKAATTGGRVKSAGRAVSRTRRSR